MSRSIAVACAATLVMVLDGCVSLSDASRKLDVGMTEKDVISLIGSEPQSVSLSTCGTKTDKPWQCKEYDYRNHWNGGWLNIHFSQDASGLWRVNDWHYY